jgi:hypothetical protein
LPIGLPVAASHSRAVLSSEAVTTRWPSGLNRAELTQPSCFIGSPIGLPVAASHSRVSWIQDGIRDYQATGAALRLPYFLSLKAEALYLADRTVEALGAIKEAEVVAERSEGRWWCAEMHRLRGVFLATLGAEESQIEASFCEAIRTAKQQKSISLAKRAEVTYAEYRRQKASGSGGRGIRLALC